MTSYLENVKNMFLDKNVSDSILALEKSHAKEVATEADMKSFIKSTILKHVFADDIVNEDNNGLQSTCILGEDVLSDLEIIKDYQNECPQNTLLHMLSASKEWMHSQHNLQGSQFYLENVLSRPIFDTDILQKRQTVIKNVLGQSTQEHIKFSWNVLRKNEGKICWFFDQDPDLSNNIYDLVYLNIWLLDKLNNSSAFLTGYNLYRIILSPLIGIFTPICYIIIPYIVLRMKWKIKIDFKTYLKMSLQMFMSSSGILPPSIDRFRKISIGFTVVFYFQGLFNSVELSKAIFKLTKVLVTKMNGLINFIHHAQFILSCYDHVLDPSPFHFKSFEESVLKTKHFQDCFDANMPHNQQILGGEDGESFSLISNFGRQLSHYKYLKIDKYITVFQRIYFLDFILSIGRLTIKNDEDEGEEKEKEKGIRIGIGRSMCFPQFIDTKLPLLRVNECFHPTLSKIPFLKIVKNDIHIEKDNPDRDNNILLTGPNAGGKSTIIKSLMIAVLLAQTLTVSNCSNMEISPFRFINTQINIPDCKGKQSLFEAEMMRSKKNFEIIDEISGKSIIAMDEIFSSTNPIEGMAGAYAIAHKLGQNPNVINIISTHYVFLTKLEKKDGLFTNYKMNVNLDESNNVVDYPYKLYKGVSRQYIALELLRKNGFDESIIEEAVSIKNGFMQPTKEKKRRENK